MKSLQKIAELANKFEKKLQKMAQQASAQAGDIDKALYSAGVRPEANDLAPYVNSAGIPDEVKDIKIGIVVDPGLNVRFNVVGSPNHPSVNALANKLNSVYSSKMSAALKNAKVSVGGPVSVPMATF